MPLVPEVGSCSYNGVAWDATVHSQITGRPTPDESGRTHTDWEYSVSMRGRVTPDPSASSGGTTDGELEDIRKRLFKPGGELIYEDKGFGTLHVNGSSTVRDVAFGPKITHFRWVPLGSRGAAYVEWTCVTRVPECVSARYQKAVMAFNNTVDIDADDLGYATVTTSGYLEIPMTRTAVENRLPPDTVDNYIERIRPRLLVGFRRKTRRQYTADRRRVNFSFVDVQLPRPMPTLVAEARVKYRVRSTSGPNEGFVNWSASLSGSMSLFAGAEPISLVWTKILAVFSAKYNASLNIGVLGNVGGILPVLGPVVGNILGVRTGILREVDVGEDVFGAPTDFNFRWTVIGGDLRTFVANSGMWRLIPGTSHAAWSGAAENTVYSPRGPLQIRLSNSDDTIVDLCGGVAQQAQFRGNQVAAGNVEVAPFAGQVNNPALTWLGYQNELYVRTNRRVSRHVTMNTEAASEVSVQSHGAPTELIVMEGASTRVGFFNTIPNLLAVRGFPTTLVGGGSSEQVTGNVGGLPIYTAIWRFFYWAPNLGLAQIVNNHQGAGVLANPLLQTPDIPRNPLGAVVPPTLSNPIART